MIGYPLGIRALSRKYTDHALVLFSHIINALLTKLARSRWLDIGLVLFLSVYGPRRSLDELDRDELEQYPAILTSRLVNYPHILFFTCNQNIANIFYQTVEKQVSKEPNSVQMIDARAVKLSSYSYPITKSSNWTAVIGYPRDRATITQQIGGRRTNHERAFCNRYDYALNNEKHARPNYNKCSQRILRVKRVVWQSNFPVTNPTMRLPFASFAVRRAKAKLYGS